MLCNLLSRQQNLISEFNKLAKNSKLRLSLSHSHLFAPFHPFTVVLSFVHFSFV